MIHLICYSLSSFPTGQILLCLDNDGAGVDAVGPGADAVGASKGPRVDTVGYSTTF